MRHLRQQKRRALTLGLRAPKPKKAASVTRIPPLRPEKCGMGAGGALPRGNAVFECLGVLRVDELDRKAFLEVSHHAGLDLAEHDHRLQRWAAFRGDRGAR